MFVLEFGNFRVHFSKYIYFILFISGGESQTCNFKCEHCTERFLDRRALTWHEKKVHNVIRNTQNSDKDIFCEHCGQSYPTLHKLSVHKSMKHAGKETATGNILPANMEIGELIQQNTCSPSEVKCVDCNLIYINSDELLRHISAVHVNKTE